MLSVRRSAACVGLAVVAVLGCHAAPAHASQPAARLIRLLQRLSLDLRAQTLSGQERSQALARLGRAERVERIYDDHVARWLDEAAFSRLVRPFFPKQPGQRPAVARIFMRLAAAHDPASHATTFYLPHAIPAGPSTTSAPCAERDVVEVRPWWAKRPVRICANSYLPERSFDAVGYCAGQAEPTVPQPPRAGCGCGPLLLACLPPPESEPGLEQAIDRAIADELFKTAGSAVYADRSLDELVVGTRTWQSGLVELMYLRRELIGLLARQPYSPTVQAELERRLDAIDLQAPARWVDRQGIYRGTGLWFTPVAVDTLQPTYRAVVIQAFTKFLCVDFSSVHVDSEALLRAVGSQHMELRALAAVNESPMRNQEGCKGCHAPMDNTAGFLAPLRMPILGSFPTGLDGKGQLYLKGADDYRGQGVGIAAFADLIVKQPEFADCAARVAFRVLVDRTPSAAERAYLDGLAAQFRDNGHRWAPIVRDVLRSRSYAEELDGP